LQYFESKGRNTSSSLLNDQKIQQKKGTSVHINNYDSETCEEWYCFSQE